MERKLDSVNVSRETMKRLERYADLLLKWNEKINLISAANALWPRHIEDSAQLFSLIPNPHIRLLDIGSGAGFPGLILAILGVSDVHLVESDARKCAFLREAARITETPITIHHTRVETLELPGIDIITARALAPLSELLALAKPHLQPHSFCLFPKGKNYSIEVEEARRQWRFEAIATPSKTAESAVILTLKLEG